MLRFFLSFFFILTLSCTFDKKSNNKEILQNDQQQESMDPEKLKLRKINRADDYSQILDLLNKRDLQSIDVAITVFQHANVDSLSSDSMLVSFNDFFAAMTSTYLENNDSLQGKKGIDISDETSHKIKERLSGYGMNLTTAEGEFYLEPDNDFLIQKFGDKVSTAYRDYLVISAKEQKQKFADDGTLIIPADSLAGRIAVWEDFMEKYPSFVAFSRVQDLYAQYMETYLSGIENSKAFDPSTKKLKDDLRKSFENYMQQYPGRKSTAVIQGYYDLLKSSGFQYSEKTDQYILEKLYN